jgi:paraquat-inducible protein B
MYTPFQMHVLVRHQMAHNGKRKRKGKKPEDVLWVAPTVAAMYGEGFKFKASQRRGGERQLPRFYRKDVN